MQTMRPKGLEVKASATILPFMRAKPPAAVESDTRRIARIYGQFVQAMDRLSREDMQAMPRRSAEVVDLPTVLRRRDALMECPEDAFRIDDPTHGVEESHGADDGMRYLSQWIEADRAASRRMPA